MSIIHAIRNMFARKPKPAIRPPFDGKMGPRTRVVIAKHAATPHMPEPPRFHFWDVYTSGYGMFRVELARHSTRGPKLVTALHWPMSDLSPETIAAMARTIMHWRTKF